MKHGGFAYSQGCRCDICRAAKKAQLRRGAARLNLTPEQRRRCLICKVELNVHPMVACWREVR